MKRNTLLLLKTHLDSGNIYFSEDYPGCRFNLTNGRLCDIIQAEYGIRPKRSRIIQKKLKQLINSLLKKIIKDHDGCIR